MSAFTSDRERGLHLARVYLEQARAFRLRGSPFALTLLEWAGNARRRAIQDDAPISFARGWNNCIAVILAAKEQK